jgi:integrase
MVKDARRGTLWFCEGDPWTYRHPFFEKGKWRCRRRNRVTGAVEKITLDAENVTAARSEARKKADTELREGPEDPQVLTAADSVGAALDLWAATFEVRPATKAAYDLDVELYKRLLGEAKPVSAVSFQDVQGLFTGSWKGLKGRTKIKHRGMLIRFFDWTAKAKLARGNPARDVKVERAWSKQSTKAAQATGQALTLDEARKLLENCKEKRSLKYERKHYGEKEKIEAEVVPPSYLWLFALISLRTGLRLSNVIGSEQKPGLLWRHVDLKEGTLRIEGELMKNDLPLHVPLHQELIDELNALLRTLEAVPQPNDRVIPGLRDGQELKKSFRAALERAGFGPRGFRIHDLRHSFLSWLGESCTHAAMQVLAGHSAKSVTDRYAKHQEMDSLRTALNALPRLLGASPGARAVSSR